MENTSEHFAANENQALNLYDNTRPKRGRKVADIHKSPYFDRLTAIYGKLSEKRNLICGSGYMLMINTLSKFFILQVSHSMFH